jgi:hypothetical protein
VHCRLCMPTAFSLCLKQLNAGSRAWGNRRFFSTLTPFSNCDSTIQTGGYQKRVKRMDTTDGHTSAHCTISTVVTFGNTRTHSRHTHTQSAPPRLRLQLPATVDATVPTDPSAHCARPVRPTVFACGYCAFPPAMNCSNYFPDR